MGQLDTKKSVPQEDLSHRPLRLRGVIPGLTRNPEAYFWIPACAGMTICKLLA